VLSSGDISDLLDPMLDVEHDEAEVRRMATAACLCLRRSARLRPPISQVSFSFQLVRYASFDCISLTSLLRRADTEHTTRREHGEHRRPGRRR
jgi:hypothetical protein